MCCALCANPELRAGSDGLKCAHCGAHYPLRQGVLDMLGAPGEEVITPFQRVMQTPLIVSIYENFWRRAGYYLASSRSFSREVETVVRHERGRNCARLLDLACGPGVFTRPLARQTSGIVVGFDLSWPMLQQARKLVDREGLKNVVLIRGTAFHLPFVASAFDYVNCCGALHLFDQPAVALKEIDRVLRREGHLCVQTTIRPDHSGGIAFLLERFIRFGFFGESRLLEMIHARGFTILESERHRISYTFLAQH
jgi:ubiquinone/menaquinone biosynthesis C-methylase UbiE